jgi:hypothetical protein
MIEPKNVAGEGEAKGRSLMAITGRNAFAALLLALIVAFLLSVAYTLLSLFADAIDHREIEFWIIPQKIWFFFKTMSICAAPIVFIISFGLLQRVKIP